jgi:hypothetical protein
MIEDHDDDCAIWETELLPDHARLQFEMRDEADRQHLP